VFCVCEGEDTLNKGQANGKVSQLRASLGKANIKKKKKKKKNEYMVKMVTRCASRSKKKEGGGSDGAQKKERTGLLPSFLRFGCVMPGALLLCGNHAINGGILKAFRQVARGYDPPNVNFDEIGKTIKAGCDGGSLSLLHLDFKISRSNVKWGPSPPAATITTNVVNTLDNLTSQLVDAIGDKTNCVVVLTAYYSQAFAEQLRDHGFRNVIFLQNGNHWEPTPAMVAQFCEKFYTQLSKKHKWRAAFNEARVLQCDDGVPCDQFMHTFEETSGPDFAPMHDLPFKPRISGNRHSFGEYPSSLLVAEYRVVDFAGHEKWLCEYEEWCMDKAEPRVAVRLLYGPAGAGKTRAMVELTEQLRAKGIVAGFVTHRATVAEFQRLLEEDRRVVVVLDNAETWHGLADLLRVVAAVHPKAGSGHLRIVLLARHTGDWLNHLQKFMDIRVEEIPKSTLARTDVFHQARTAFAKKLGKSLPDRLEVPVLEDDKYGRVLTVHLAALGTLLGLKSNDMALLDALLDHEEQYWFCGCEIGLWTTARNANFHESFRRLVAAVVLRGGFVSEDWVTQVSQKLRLTRLFDEMAQAGIQDGDLGSLLRRLYPPPLRSSQYLAPLEPDFLGDAMVVRVLKEIGCEEDLTYYFQTVLHNGNEHARREGGNVLGRLNTDQSQVELWRGALLSATVLK